MAYKYTYFDRTRRFLVRELPNFFKNIWKFRKALWNHNWFDYAGTLEFLEIGISDIQKNISIKGIEVEHSRDKKIKKMKRVVEILKNIRECNHFDIVEAEMGRKYNTKKIKFVECEDNPDYYELVDFDNEEEKEFNNKFFKRVNELEEEEWVELWETLKGQDREELAKSENWDEAFDGSGLRGWWD